MLIEEGASSATAATRPSATAPKSGNPPGPRARTGSASLGAIPKPAAPVAGSHGDLVEH